MHEPAVVIVTSTMCLLAAVLCTILGLYLLTQRYAKLHYRLCVGLCLAFVINNYICGFALLFNFLSTGIWDAIHVSESGVTVLYILSIFLIYLLKSMGYSDEALSGVDKYIHPAIWIFATLYFFAVWYNHIIANTISIALLIFASGFSIFVTVHIVVKHRRDYKNIGEVNSPLISSSKKAVIAGFHFRLFMFLLLVLAEAVVMGLVVFGHVIYVPEAKHEFWNLMVLMSCSLTGLFVLVLLTTAPELKRYFKQNRAKRNTRILSD